MLLDSRSFFGLPSSVTPLNQPPNRKRVFKELKNTASSRNLLVPNIRVESVREKNIGAIIDRINVLLNDVDVIYISSDDYLLSVALTLAGLRAGKKISYFSEDEIVELKI